MTPERPATNGNVFVSFDRWLAVRSARIKFSSISARRVGGAAAAFRENDSDP
jgi:hypothetical protein